jgi:bifunctional DNA-binding transcriptional regulator/antitoxin component of YhaV-PrlF toxin-antitoxin module
MASTSGTARMDERGRLVLPVDLRRRLGFEAGDEFRITEEDNGTLRIESRRGAARALIGLAGLADKDVLKELRAERRRQATTEDRDAKRQR